VPSTVIGPQRKEVKEGLTELHSELRHSPYVSLCPIIIKSVVMRWGRHGARTGVKNVSISMRDICTKYDTFKVQAYKERYTKIQLGEMGYKNNDLFQMARDMVRWQRFMNMAMNRRIPRPSISSPAEE